MTYRKGVFIVTYRKEPEIKYLLLKRSLHWKGWEFPKGGIDNKEPILKAIKREVKEEVGQPTTNIKNHKHTGKYKYKTAIKGRTSTGQTFSLYSAEIKNKIVKLDKHEHTDYKWLTFNQAMKKLTWPNQRRCLKIVNKKLCQ